MCTDWTVDTNQIKTCVVAVDVPPALRAVYDNYISRWQDNALPWGQPTLGRESRIGSRAGSRGASYTSDASVSSPQQCKP